MIAFPHAKINIGLNILSKRKDGYHNVETILYPIAYKDALEIIPSKKFCISSYGIDLPEKEEINLCTKAFKIIKEKYKIPDVKIVLYKNIPIGAGLGGGSSNAVYTLKLLNRIFELNLNSEELENYSKKLGVDCPFFLDTHPKIATGKGESLKNCELNLSGYIINVVTPDFYFSTKDAYKNIRYFSNSTLKVDNDIFHWKEKMTNDFEKNLSHYKNEIQDIKDKLYEEGAIYASMSGSGSSVYGIFNQKRELKKVFPNYRVWQGKFLNTN
jgi:4-diphosphocytidyl-2-C-methyl-D-erythritol kinase